MRTMSRTAFHHTLQHSPSVEMADDYENKLMNGILGIQRPGVVRATHTQMACLMATDPHAARLML